MKKLILLFSLFFFLMAFAQEKKEINTDTKTENIEKQISDLQKQIKVLEEQQLDKSKEVENIYKNDREIIEKVEDFYERSWNKLINLIGWVATMTGIIVPISIGWLQNRNFDRLETNGEKLQKQLKESSDNFQKQLDDNYKTFQEQLEIKITDTEEKLKTLFNREYDKLKQEVSNNVMQMNEELYNNINYLKFFSFSIQADINIKNKEYVKAINCYGACLIHLLKTIPTENLTKNALLIINYLEDLITFVSEENINIDLSSYKERKEDTLKSLNHILTSNILPEENERIQKIINFIENH